eukprot:3183954-Rhodomonas_salina.2
MLLPGLADHFRKWNETLDKIQKSLGSTLPCHAMPGTDLAYAGSFLRPVLSDRVWCYAIATG